MSEPDRTPSLPLYEVPYRRLFPWLELFRCPASAADPKRLMLAALGLGILELGLGLGPTLGLGSAGIVPVSDLLITLSEPARVVMTPFLRVFDPSADAQTRVLNLGVGLGLVTFFGLIGGAIARIAAVDLAKRERIGLVEAVRFSLRKVVSLVGTPLMPLLGVVVVSAPLAGFGLLYRLGPIGATVAGLLAFLPLIGGLLLTLIVIGLALGWPLMHAATAAEAEDGFDAMSRAYAYVHQRPWHLAAYLALGVVIGAVGLVVVSLFAWVVLTLAEWALTLGGPGATVRAYYHQAADPSSAGELAASAHRFWLGVVGLLVRGWVYSYFWTTATAIYLLLRREVDGTPWATIAHESPVSPFHALAAELAATGGGSLHVPTPQASPAPDEVPSVESPG